MVGQGGVQVITWEALQGAGIGDAEQVELLDAVSCGVPVLSSALKEYARYMDELSVVDGVLVYKGKLVVSRTLTEGVLR